MKSMTGYGRATSAIEQFSLTVQVSSVNRKTLDLTIALPEEWESMEPAIGDARRAAGVLGDEPHARREVARDACAVGGCVLVVPARVASRDAGRQLVALRVTHDAAVQVVRVRGDFDETRVRERAHLIPTQEVGARQRPPGLRDAGLAVDPARDIGFNLLGEGLRDALAPRLR